MVADDGELIAGHGRVLSAALLGLTEVPVIRRGVVMFPPLVDDDLYFIRSALSEKRAMKKSIIAGATGLVGAKLVKALEANGDPLIVLARRPIAGLSANTKWMKADFDDLIAGGSLPPCDHVYICLGTTMKKAGSKDAFWKVDFEYCLAVAQKARDAGATTLSLVSSVGANAESNNFYLHTKGALEKAITALDFPTVNIYRPSFLLGNRTERRPLEALGIHLFKAIGPLFIGGSRKYRGIDVELLAATMVKNTTSTRIPEGINYFHFNEISGG